jgi:hypothetical protein
MNSAEMPSAISFSTISASVSDSFSATAIFCTLAVEIVEEAVPGC